MADVPAVTEDISFSANFKFNKKQVEVNLSEDSISIGTENTKKIFFQDILKVEVKEKKDDNCVILNLIYIERKNPTAKCLRKTNLLLEGSETDCTSLHEKVDQEVQKVPGRPKSLLVIVNPKSGGCSGEKIYEKQVSPLFDIAGIKTVVRVSERSGHIPELLKNETLSNYDGIVVVGGDGTLHECLNGLIPIVQKEANINIDDPASDLAPTSITFGMIPAGTGNGLAEGATGKDISTAALSIVRGNKTALNVNSFHSNNKLLSYSFLLLGYGYFSDLIHDTETKRWMGRSRYFVVILGSLFSKSRVFGAEVEYLPVVYDKPPTTKFEIETTDAEEPGWKKVSDKFTTLFSINMEVTDSDQDVRTALCKNGVSLFLERSYSRLSHFRWFKTLFGNPARLNQLPGMNQVNVREFKVKLESEFSEDKNSAQSDVRPVEQAINIDGELYWLPCSSFHYKFHKEVAQLFVLDKISS